MASLGKERRMERLNAYVEPGAIVSDRTYNLVLGGTVLYGVVINALLCKFVGGAFVYMYPIQFLVAYLLLAVVGMIMANRSDNPAISFLGYNMIVVPLGIMIAAIVDIYGGIDSAVVTDAFYYTALITAIMIFAALAFPNVFDRIGGFLFVSLIGLLVCGVFAVFFSASAYRVYSFVAAAIFSLYIGYDFHRSQMFAKTVDNAIDCAIDIYLDIANLFVKLVEIFGRRD